ncbi:MAG: RHS repeat-associated core domain-containing protein, partial [Wenzhouxiangella sp.]|nr:RHS repeat-associated core domain-containing protein [Wenzhouxiangella sp.]
MTVQAADPDGAVATQDFEIAVRAANSAPQIITSPPTTVTVGELYSARISASDADGDPLTFDLLDGPSGMTLHPGLGWLHWNTTAKTPGSYPIALKVSDDWGGADDLVFELELLADNEAPVVEINVLQVPACRGEPVDICVEASDNVGLVSTSLDLAGQERALTAVGCYAWTPDDFGEFPAIAEAFDPSGQSASASESVFVADCNDEQRPVVTLFTPQIDELLLEPTPLIVSIDDNTPAALTWTVSIRAGLDGEPEMLSEGTGPVDEAEVALIDTTLLPEGEYWISILGSDGAQTGGIDYRLNVGAGYKPGRLRIANADVNLPLAGIPLTIGRSYDSLDAGRHGASPGDLGPGWRLALSGSVTDSAREPTDPDNPLAQLTAEPFSEQTRVSVIKPDGERVGFTFAPKQKAFPSLFQFDVEFEADPGVEDTLRAVDGPEIVFALGAGFADYIIPYNPSIYELETPERVVYVFSEDEGLIEIRDALGGTLTISDDGIQSSRGPAIDYVRDEMGRVTEILLPPAEPGAERGKVVYEFDALGNLSTMTDLGGGVTRFEYDNPDYPHHLSAVIDPRGVTMTRQIYDADGRLIAQCPADGDSETLEGCTTYNFDIAGSVETIFDTRGFQSDLVYDENGQVVSRRDWMSPTEWIEQSWVYDDDGRVIEYTDGEGGRTLYEFDEQGNEVARTLPGGETYRWTFGNCRNEWLSATDPLGNTWQQELDEDCRVRFATDPLGGVTEYQYNAQGLRTAIIDPVGQSWSFTFTDRGQIATVTDPKGAIRSHSYDGLGNEISVVRRDGQQIDFEYDQGGSLISETWVGTGHVRTWQYNEVGLVTRESSPDSTVEVEYWPIGRIKRLDHTAPGAPSWWVAYEYDGNGNVIEVSDSAGGTTAYEYDPLDRMIAVSQFGTGVLPKRVEVDYNRAGLATAIRRFGDLAGTVPGPYSLVEYECSSCITRLTRLDHRRPDDSSVHELLFTRNANGQITEMIDAEGTHTFVYDGRGWLVQSSHPPVPGLNGGATSYDAMGNWLTRPEQPGPATLSYAVGDGGHELLNDGEQDFDYDERGAMVLREHTVSGETLELAYDARTRLRAATLRDDQGSVTLQASYGYTPSGTRVFAEVDGQERHFIYDGYNVIAALDQSGDVVWRRLHPRSVDRPLAVDDGQQIQWLLSDHNGSVRDTVDNSGSVLSHFAYTPWGEQILGPPPGLDDPIRYTGREFDLPGGLGYYRARNYDPGSARFLSQDPIEPWHYRYGDNNPLRFNDPSGETTAIEYLLIVCDALSAASSGQAAGGVLEEAVNQVVA